MKQTESYIALNLIKSRSLVDLNRLINSGIDINDFFKLSVSEAVKISELKKETVESIFKLRKNPLVKKEREKADRYGCKIISYTDDEYPQALKTIYNPPVVLYVKGSVDLNKNCMISIIGARKASSYGLQVSRWLGEKIADLGIIIVSGLAVGIDASSHRGALDSPDGKTIAVLGSGMDIEYPYENRELFKQIHQRGAVITEYPFQTPPFKWNFPLRNRIVSGLSMGVIVVEAGERSGSLITAGLALEQGREVFAVPGSIKSQYSKGTNKLIKDGAKLVLNIEDIIEELPIAINNFARNRSANNMDLNEDEKRIFEFISSGISNPEELILSLGFEPEKVSKLLVHMEIKGIIKRYQGNNYVVA